MQISLCEHNSQGSGVICAMIYMDNAEIVWEQDHRQSPLRNLAQT